MKYVFILVLKTIFLTLIIIIARGTFPRFKVDSLIIGAWKEFLHVFIIFLITGTWSFWYLF